MLHYIYDDLVYFSSVYYRLTCLNFSNCSISLSISVFSSHFSIFTFHLNYSIQN